MPRIDNEVLLMLRAEDHGFVEGLRRASHALEELQKSLSDFARVRGANPIKETDEYTKGLTKTIREAIPAVRQLLETISDRRKISGATFAYQNLAATFEEVARRHGMAARLIRRQLAVQEQELNQLLKTRERLFALNKEQAELMGERRTLRDRTDTEAAQRIQEINRRLEEIRTSQARSSLQALNEEMRPLARSVKNLKEQLSSVEAQYLRNLKLANTINKTAAAADKGVAAAQNELVTVQLLNRLERQRAQALDERVKKAKIAAEAARQQQREELKLAMAQEAYNRAVRNLKQASVSQKVGVFLQSLAATVQRASTAYGFLTSAAALFSKQQLTVHNVVSGTGRKMSGLAGAIWQMGAAMRNGAQMSMALGQNLARVAIALGLIVAATKTAVRVVGMLIPVLARVAAAMLRVGVVAAQSLYNGLKLIVGMSGRFVSSMGNILRILGTKTAAIWSAIHATRQYSRETMAIADATGWHSRSLKGLVGNVVNLNRWINTLGSSIRQIGQAFQNTGMTFSVFLSYPVGRTLSNWISTALEFDKALIEVRKNADLLIDSVDANVYTLQNLKQELLDLAQETPTPLTELGEMAVDAARLGLPPEFIQPFVQVMDQLVVATNLTADDAVKSVGRIMNIFYDLSSAGMQDVEAFQKAVKGLASSINELGQSNPVGENEIVAALLRMAPAASAIGMDLPMAVGLAASVASASATAERAGTQLNNALTQMAAKLKQVAVAAGVTQDIFADIVNQDPGVAFLSIVEAIAKIPDAVQRAKVANALFGMVGGKAANALGASFEKVIENVALSKVAFEDATSVALEFERALDAVSNQIGLFKNQLSVIGIAIGDAILPVITQILSYAIPVFQALAKLFQQLDDKTKLWIVGIGMLITVLGPLMFAFGSLLFSVGILTTGLTGLFNVFGNLLKLPVKLAGALLFLVAPFGLIKTAIAAAVIYLLFFGNTLDTVVKWINEIASNMYNWGYNMFISFAEGIYAAATFVIQAVYDTLSAIAAMLRSFSPPKEGPLKDIDKWGYNIGTTFADAFATADLSGIVTFGEKINTVLEKTIRGLDVIALSIFDSLWNTISQIIQLVEKDEKKGLSAFLNLLSVLQKGTGDIYAAFGALGEQLGAFATDIMQIIKLQVLYNIEVEKSKKLKQQIEELDEKTQKQIRDIAGDESLTVSARIARIRAVKAGAAIEKSALEAQLKLSERQQESLKELIDIQKQYIEIFKEFYKEERGRGGGRGRGESDFERAAKEGKEKLDELQGALDDFSPKGIQEKLDSATQSIQKSFQKSLEDGGRFVKRMNEARASVAAFIDALLGKPINQEELEAYGQAYEDAYNKGKAWRDGIIQWAKDLEEATRPVREFMEAVRLLLLIFATGYTGQDMNKVLNKDDSQKAKNIFGEYLEVILGLGSGLRVLIDRTKEYIEYLSKLFSGEEGGVVGQIIRSLIEFGIAFARAFSKDNPGISNLGNIIGPIKSIVDSLVILAGLVFDNLDVLGEFLGNAARYVVMIAGYVGVVLEFLKSLAGFGDRENLKKNLELTGNEWLKNLFSLEGLEGKDFAQRLVDLIISWIRNADFSEVGKVLGQKIQEALFGTKDLSTGKFSGGLFGGLGEMFDPEAIRQFLNNLIAALASLVSSIELQPLVNALSWLLETLFVTLSNSDAINKLGEWLGVLIGQVAKAIPFESLAVALAVIVNGIIAAMKTAVESGMVQSASRDLVNAIILALSRINWMDVSETVADFVKTMLKELARVNWGKLGTVLSDFVVALVNAITGVFGDVNTYKNLGAVLGGLAGAIVKGLTGADWGKLFTPASLVDFVRAFIEGITEAYKLARKPDFIIEAEKAEADLPKEKQQEIKELQERFEALVRANAALPGIAYTKEQIAEMERIQARLVELDADRNRIKVIGETIDEIKKQADSHREKFKQVTDDLMESVETVYSEYEKAGKKLQEAVEEFFGFLFEPFVPKSAKAQGKEGVNKQDNFSIYGPQIQAQEGGSIADNIVKALNQIIADIKQWIEDNKAILQETGGLLVEQVLTGFETFVKENAATYYVVLPTRFNSWIEENIVPLQILGHTLGSHILTGLAIFFRDNAAGAYSTLLFQFTLWLDANFTVLQGYGRDVANRIREGISTRLGENYDYYNEIANALSRFVASIDKKHSISKDGEKIGEKIVKAISRGIKDNWKKIAESIEEAVQRAIDSVKITVSSSNPDDIVSGSSISNDPNNIVGSSSVRIGVNDDLDDIVGVASASDVAENLFRVVKGGFANIDYLLNYAFDDTLLNKNNETTINIYIENVVADNPKKAKEIAELISREIAKRTRLVYGVR